jgi:agmatine deiminase
MDLFDLKNIVWLPGGLEEDDTDGHIDNIFAPIGDNKYLIACSDLDDRRNYSILQKNKEILEQFFLLKNINAEIIQIPLPSEIIVENKRLVASYINFYFTKNSIFVPKFNVKEDELKYMIFFNHYLLIKKLKW